MSKYASGKRSKAICPVSGKKIPYRKLKRRWDGVYVSPEYWDPKHPQLDPTWNVDDPQGLEHPYPDRDNDNPNDDLTQLNTVTGPTFGETS